MPRMTRRSPGWSSLSRMNRPRSSPPRPPRNTAIFSRPPDDQFRDLAKWKMEGFTNQEIAAKHQCAPLYWSSAACC